MHMYTVNQKSPNDAITVLSFCLIFDYIDKFAFAEEQVPFEMYHQHPQRVQQDRLGGPWPMQIFDWVGRNAFGPPINSADTKTNRTSAFPVLNSLFYIIASLVRWNNVKQYYTMHQNPFSAGDLPRTLQVRAYYTPPRPYSQLGRVHPPHSGSRFLDACGLTSQHRSSLSNNYDVAPSSQHQRWGIK